MSPSTGPIPGLVLCTGVASVQVFSRGKQRTFRGNWRGVSAKSLKNARTP